MKSTTDTQRLNWLEEQNACLRYDAEDEASISHAVVFLPTLENGESTFRATGHGDTYRAAVDDAVTASDQPASDDPHTAAVFDLHRKRQGLD